MSFNHERDPRAGVPAAQLLSKLRLLQGQAARPPESCLVMAGGLPRELPRQPAQIWHSLCAP
jgi:hypothetical protein